MNYTAHHELQVGDLRVKVCVPQDETESRKSQLKTQIVQVRQGFCRKTKQQSVA